MSDENARAFNRSRATRGVVLHLYPRLLVGFGKLFFFANLSLQYFRLDFEHFFCHFSVVDGFGSSWMGRHCWSTPLMLVFLKTPYFVLYFPCYTLMIFLIILSAMLLSKLVVLLSTLRCNRASDFVEKGRDGL